MTLVSLVPDVLTWLEPAESESSPFCRTDRGLCLSPFLTLSSVRVLLLLLPCETGQPGAEQHGAGCSRPRAIVRPADLTGTCRAQQTNQEKVFTAFIVSVWQETCGQEQGSTHLIYV